MKTIDQNKNNSKRADILTARTPRHRIWLCEGKYDTAVRRFLPKNKRVGQLCKAERQAIVRICNKTRIELLVIHNTPRLWSSFDTTYERSKCIKYLADLLSRVAGLETQCEKYLQRE